MQHKHLFPRFFIPSLLFLIGLTGGFFLLRSIDMAFRIKHIEVYGVTSDERSVLQKTFADKSTLFIKNAEIQSSIRMRFPTVNIKECRISFPNTLIIVLQKEKPLAYLHTDQGFISLSKKGVVLSKERAQIIPSPSIDFYQTVHHLEYQVGQMIQFSAIGRALLFISILRDLGYETETVAIDSVDMIACKTKGFVVAFSQTRPIDLQRNEVEQIIRQMKVGALRIVRLDLRFDKPVVQLPKKNNS